MALLAAGTWLLVTDPWLAGFHHPPVVQDWLSAAVGRGCGQLVRRCAYRRQLGGFAGAGRWLSVCLSVQRPIIDTDNPFQNAKRFVPLYMFATGFMVTIMTVTKGSTSA
jgi:PiT family inorganic phosphate transporter